MAHELIEFTEIRADKKEVRIVTTKEHISGVKFADGKTYVLLGENGFIEIKEPLQEFVASIQSDPTLGARMMAYAAETESKGNTDTPTA